jgi:hypothetical protein
MMLSTVIKLLGLPKESFSPTVSTDIPTHDQEQHSDAALSGEEINNNNTIDINNATTIPFETSTTIAHLNDKKPPPTSNHNTDNDTNMEEATTVTTPRTKTTGLTTKVNTSGTIKESVCSTVVLFYYSCGMSMVSVFQ